jgi:trimeric autotransporter adhesin
MYATNPDIAARSTADNLLDIIDIAQNDPALAVSAGNATGTPSHAGGFAEQPGALTGTVQHYQDSTLAQTDFWSAFIAGANNLNNALTAEANGTAHLDTAGIQSLIQQVQGYQQLGNSFDGAQGGIFGARFDNELLGGTLNADTSTALQALNDIANNGGTVSDADAAKLVAAGTGYVADANDVSGNNTPFGGGAYVGTSTTVAGATTTHIADANTVTSGNVDGNEHATATPVDGLTNNGFGATLPAPAGGTDPAGGNGAGGTTAGGTGGTEANISNTGASGDQGDQGGNQSTQDSGNSNGSSTSTLSGNVASDLASLIQALQSGNKTAINTALSTLEGDINGNAGSNNNNNSNNNNSNGSNGSNGGNQADNGSHNSCGSCGIDSHNAHHDHHHLEMIWHHA